jgi:ribosomal protein S18 acetylase RimI-like enzyme
VVVSDGVLDNMPWYALSGPQIPFTEGSERARRFRRSVGLFCATERLDAEGWQSLIELVGPGRAIVLFQADVDELPPGVDLIDRHRTYQMVADGPPTAAEHEALTALAASGGPIRLGAADVEDMLALTALTAPGPFFAETHQLGTYLGLREGDDRGRPGALIAMAGERLRTEGASEISAVCTHPDARRRGLGAQLTAAMMDEIRARDELPLLHVVTTNTAAISIYGQLGFRVRREIEAVAVRVPRRD